jgi:hypothetical protein
MYRSKAVGHHGYPSHVNQQHDHVLVFGKYIRMHVVCRYNSCTYRITAHDTYTHKDCFKYSRPGCVCVCVCAVFVSCMGLRAMLACSFRTWVVGVSLPEQPRHRRAVLLLRQLNAVHCNKCPHTGTQVACSVNEGQACPIRRHHDDQVVGDRE